LIKNRLKRAGTLVLNVQNPRAEPLLTVSDYLCWKQPAQPAQRVNMVEEAWEALA
jgi:hypothetical protein